MSEATPTAGGLRERLAHKARRRLVLTLAITDPTLDLARVLELRQLTGLAAGDGALLERSDAEQRSAAAELVTAEVALAAHYVDLELTAMPSADFEAVVAAYPGPDEGPAAGEDGGMDWRAALPVLLAGSCDDDELRDETWWAEHLAGPAWSHGDLLGLWRSLLSLNARAPVARRPKG